MRRSLPRCSVASARHRVLTTEAEAFLAELHALAPQARVILDKMPDNTRYFSVIPTLLPGALIIHC
jgi:hypothetical protein